MQQEYTTTYDDRLIFCQKLTDDLQKLLGEDVVRAVFKEEVDQVKGLSLTNENFFNYDASDVYVELVNGRKIVLSNSEWASICLLDSNFQELPVKN